MSTYLVPDQDHFLKWDTKFYNCPLPANTQVEIIDASGTRRQGKASQFYWFYQGWSQDIAYYRVMRQSVLHYLLGLRPALPMSVETPCTIATNGEIRRWLQNKAVYINGKPASANDEMPETVESLVFFPKSALRKTTLL